jgi:S-(hydroxymethyl)glutathione dehydrogenase/alcohol dehydrogenase
MSTVGLPIKCKAMVARAPKVPMVEEEITVFPPKVGEVRVKVIANACEFPKLERKKKSE